MVIRYRPWVPAAAFGLLVGTANARADCDPTLGSSLRDAERFVATMRADKPGQARVFASDGTEYSAGLVRWMAAQLRAADKDCLNAKPAEALKRLSAVQDTLTPSHGGNLLRR